MIQGQVVVHELAVPLEGLAPAFDGFRVGHVSDLHFRRWNRTLEYAQELLRTIEYDLLAITGDFCDRPEHWPRAVELCSRFLKPIHPPYGIYGVLGNHDAPQFAESGLPIMFLRDEWVRVEVNGAWLPLAGVDQSMRDDNGLRRALAGIPPRRRALLLAHYPSTVYRLPPNRVGLTLSGHTHGGQICLPWLGCMWTNDAISRRMGRGLHRVNGGCLHVSAGIGVSPPVLCRFLCPPELTVLTLRAVAVEEDRPPCSTANMETSYQNEDLLVPV